MTQISDRTILFADLRGSTGLFETLGNAEATSVVTHCVSALGPPVQAHGGHVVKTLGDGLMAVFDTPGHALSAALKMHEVLAGIVLRGSERGASSGLRSLRLQVAISRGEVVEMAGDCFGDAVNVAARLLDHAGDNETLITAAVLNGLSRSQKSIFRSLDQMVLRGRVEPVQVYAHGGRRSGDSAATQFGDVAPAIEPDAVRLAWLDLHTGLGPSGHGERIWAGPDDAVAVARARQWWGPEVTSIYDGSSESALLTGLMWLAAGEECVQAEYTGIALEYGTVPFDQVTDALRADQWLENHPDAAPHLRTQIKRQIRDAFYTDTDAWKTRIVEQGVEAAHQAVAGLGTKAA